MAEEVTFEDAKAAMSAWLSVHQPAAVLTGAGAEDADYYMVAWDCPEDEMFYGPPLALVRKRGGDIASFYPQRDAAVLDRIKAMRPIPA
ncbi:MAG: hypothetical protein LBD70_01685 [Bifidobacteriaceae bacterium]|jgi:hypothetical protein|nr:hypothetical protein [Bifidobacteriaceae bacterium]